MVLSYGSSLEANTTGSNNVAIGPSTLSLLTGGDQNIAIGDSALFNILNGSNQNIAIGYLTGTVIGKRCIVTALYVEEKCRSLGIGAHLLTCAQQFDANANETLVCVLPGQRELKNLCEQAGLPAQLIFAGTP